MIHQWQQKQWQQFLSRKQSGTMPHAILLTGNEDSEKLDFAKACAELLLCENDTTCHLFRIGNHPDFFLIQPEEKTKLIKIDQIRELTIELTQTAQQGGNKVAIIEPAEMMNIASANALLKTLEEPASNVFILLVTAHPTRLPATIRSRCQKIIINTPQKVLEFTEERTAIVNNFLDLLNHKSNPIKFAENCKDIELKSLLYVIMSLISDIAKIKFATTTDLINADQIKSLTTIAAHMTKEKIFSCFDKLLELNKFVAANLNLNQQLAIENLAIQMTL